MVSKEEHPSWTNPMNTDSLPSRPSLFPRPYDLGADQVAFRRSLARFADEFVREAEAICGDLLDAHLARLSSGGDEVPRSREEHAMELLTFGILRGEFSGAAGATTDAEIDELADLWRIRSANPESKDGADARRAEVFQAILERNPSHDEPSDRRFVRWLGCTGEFVQEAARLELWLQSTGVFFAADEFDVACARLSAWFVPAAHRSLGRWTSGVEEFQARIRQEGRSREDILLVSRSEPIYHMNMVGAEVMNRGFRPGYDSRPDKVVLVPGCMRAKPEGQCRAVRDGLDISCSRCDPDCEVAALDRLGRERGFRVFVVPHASSFTAWLEHWQGSPSTSLLAVACPLHLVSGGYEMRALGHQAQCLMLQYSGCSRHWDPRGTPTRVDRELLLEMVGGRAA